MAIYSCRSYRRRKGYRRINAKISSRKFKGRFFKRIRPIFYKCYSKRSYRFKFLRPSKLIIRSSPGEKYYLSPNVASIRTFKSGKLRIGKRHLNVNVIRTVRSFKTGRFRGKKNPRLVPVFRYRSTKKVYRHLNICKFPIFWKFPKSQELKLIFRYNSSRLNQNLEYFVLDKSELIEFGLILKEDNSFNEILLSLLLFWESKLESSRISVVFYRYLNFEEESQWFESKSMLINVLALPNSGKGFPSPNTLSI